SSRVKHIGKNHARTGEYVVLKRDPCINRDVILDLATAPDPYPRTHNDVLAEHTALADHASQEHVRKVPYLATGPDRDSGVDDRRLVHEIVCSHSAARTGGSPAGRPAGAVPPPAAAAACASARSETLRAPRCRNRRVPHRAVPARVRPCRS